MMAPAARWRSEHSHAGDQNPGEVESSEVTWAGRRRGSTGRNSANTEATDRECEMGSLRREREPALRMTGQIRMMVGALPSKSHRAMIMSLQAESSRRRSIEGLELWTKEAGVSSTRPVQRSVLRARSETGKILRNSNWIWRSMAISRARMGRISSRSWKLWQVHGA